MGIALTLHQLKLYRAWLEQAGYEETEEQVRYEEYLRDMRYDKAMSKLAEDVYLLIGCPVCDEDCVIESDWADCNACQIRWNIEDSDDGFIYLEAEDAEDYGVENVWMAESFRDWANDELRTHGEDVTFEDWAEEEYEEPAHRHHLLLSFQEWADEEMSEEHHNAESFMMEGDCSPENWDYEAHNWEMIQLPMVRGHVHAVGWANSMGIRSYHKVCRDCGLCTECQGVHDVNLFSQSAEEFCSECGYDSKKDAETFMAETESGTQVFNSCWKCGSGQHLYQINRYPASPSEIAGVGGSPDEAADTWEEGRPVQR